MQNNTYYNDSLSNDDSSDPQSIARRIALRVQQLHDIYRENHSEGTLHLGEFFCLFFKFERELGGLESAFDMLEMIAHVPMQSVLASLQEVIEYSTPPRPTPTIDLQLAQELADSRTAPHDVKQQLSQLQTIADQQGVSLNDWSGADHVASLMSEVFESAVGGMKLLQLNGLPLYTGSFTYTFEN